MPRQRPRRRRRDAARRRPGAGRRRLRRRAQFSGEAAIFNGALDAGRRPDRDARHYPALGPAPGRRALLAGGGGPATTTAEAERALRPGSEHAGRRRRRWRVARLAQTRRRSATARCWSPAAAVDDARRARAAELYDPVDERAGRPRVDEHGAAARTPRGAAARRPRARRRRHRPGQPGPRPRPPRSGRRRRRCVTDPALAFGDAGRRHAARTRGVQITNTGDSPLLTADFALGGDQPGRLRGQRRPLPRDRAPARPARRRPLHPDRRRRARRDATSRQHRRRHATPCRSAAAASPTPPTRTATASPTPTTAAATLKGSASRQGCPTGLLADPSIRYRPSGKGIRVVAYYVKATTGARVTVKCSKGCKRTVTKGKGAKRVRITRLNQPPARQRHQDHRSRSRCPAA